MEESKTGIQG